MTDEVKTYALKQVEAYSLSAEKLNAFPQGLVYAELAKAWAIIYSGANHG